MSSSGRISQNLEPLLSALSVYAEPLVSGARVVVLGDSAFELRLVDLGARSVRVYDPDAEIDVRDGAFDLAVIPDLGTLTDAAATVARLRRIVDGRGAVVALGRARLRDAEDESATFEGLAAPTLEYGELYDAFALQFDHVLMTGVLPFTGVVFAELGAEDDVPVSVDSRLVDPPTPDVFVVVASRTSQALDGYAIVQVPAEPAVEEAPVPTAVRRTAEEEELAASFAETKLRAELLAAQLEVHRARAQETTTQLDAAVFERDAAVARVIDLEGVVAAAQQALNSVEERLLIRERALLERDDQIAALSGALEAQRSIPVAVVDLSALERAERAESALALHVADLAQVADAHAVETAKSEAQLRERASLIADMEKEIHRRDQLVRELVADLEEARQGTADTSRFEAAVPLPALDTEEVAALRRKVEELSLEVARREGELVARGWRIVELEGQKGVGDTALHAELARTKEELFALRQALTQEHAARVAEQKKGRETREETVREDVEGPSHR